MWACRWTPDRGSAAAAQGSTHSDTQRLIGAPQLTFSQTWQPQAVAQFIFTRAIAAPLDTVPLRTMGHCSHRLKLEPIS